MKREDILDELKDRCGEWIETAGEQSSALLINVLIQMLIQERNYNEFLRKRLENATTAKF